MVEKDKELKTLKDLCSFGTTIKNINGVGFSDKSNYELNLVLIKDLRKEAVKWIKRKQETQNLVSLDSTANALQAQIDILMKFFNLRLGDII